MNNWYDYLSSGVLLTGCAFALRELLIIFVCVWSVFTDEKGREHALKLLKVLRVQLRQTPPEIPPQQIPPASPPQVPPGPTGGAAV